MPQEPQSIGNRIIVRGPSGSGKTTLAQEIAKSRTLPHIELDALFWRANWQKASDEDFRAQVDKATSGPAWVMCGSYSRIHSLVNPRADTFIFLDYPFIYVLKQLLKRTWIRGSRKEMLWGHSQESLWRNVFSWNHSVVWWMIRTFRAHRNRCEAAMRNPPPGATVIRIRSRADLEALLDEVRPGRD